MAADRLQDRLDRVGNWALLPLLAASTLLAGLTMAFTGYGTPHRFYYGLFAVAGTALWSVLVTIPARTAKDPRRLAIACVGQLAFAAVLVEVNPWFGLFAWTNYMIVDELPHHWDKLALAVNAMIAAAAQIGGFPSGDSVTWGAWLLVGAINAAVVFVLVDVTNRVVTQNAERGEIIAELNATNARLESALAENAGLHAQLVEQAREAGVQDERQRLAGEIHDTLAQGLIGIVTQLEAAEQARHLPDEQDRHLAQARDLARSSLVEARRSVRALRPEQLEHATLLEALHELTHTWSLGSGVPVRTEATGGERRLSTDIEAALFRVAQEGLANAGKHAHAGKVWVTITFLDDIVLLDVRDDGVGFDPHERGAGFGLDGMRRRLERIGGTLTVETAPGEGTALSASVPG